MGPPQNHDEPVPVGEGSSYVALTDRGRPEQLLLNHQGLDVAEVGFGTV
jgi:hypothetical protein